MMSPNQTLPHTTAATRKGWRDRAIVAGLVLLFAVGAVGIARVTDWRDILAQMARLGALQVAILLGLSLANYLLRGLRWHLFVHSLGLRTPFLRNMVHFLGGFAMSVTPGRVGELVRVRWLARDAGVGMERAAPVVLGDRASDLAALAILLGASVTLAATNVHGAIPVALLALVGAFVATHPRLLARCLSAIYALSGHRKPRLFARMRRAALSLEAFAKGGVLIPALTCGLIGWACEAWAFHLLLLWFGADVSFAKALAIFIFSTLAGGLTGAPGGLGGAEAAMVAALSLDGTPMGVAVAATAVIRATTLWFAVGLGLVAFPFAERASATRG